MRYSFLRHSTFGDTRTAEEHGGSPNSTEALFTPESLRDTLPLFAKPLAHPGNRSPIIDYTMRIVTYLGFAMIPNDRTSCAYLPSLLEDLLQAYLALPKRLREGDAGDLHPISLVKKLFFNYFYHSRHTHFVYVRAVLCKFESLSLA